jgi:hypothetical protein
VIFFWLLVAEAVGMQRLVVVVQVDLFIIVPRHWLLVITLLLLELEEFQKHTDLATTHIGQRVVMERIQHLQD